MEASSVWWVLAGAAIAVELLSGTFYLLMLAGGLAAGALAAHAGWSLQAQLLLAALVGGGAVGVWHGLRARRQSRTPDDNRDVHLDIGETVQVEEWRADGTAVVRYRGANWSAVREPGSAPDTGSHRVKALQGNQLILEKL